MNHLSMNHLPKILFNKTWKKSKKKLKKNSKKKSKKKLKNNVKVNAKTNAKKNSNKDWKSTPVKQFNPIAFTLGLEKELFSMIPSAVSDLLFINWFKKPMMKTKPSLRLKTTSRPTTHDLKRLVKVKIRQIPL